MASVSACKRDIGIGMAGEGLRVRDADAAEHDVIAWAESMHVDAGAGAHIAEHGGLRRLGAREIFRRW